MELLWKLWPLLPSYGRKAAQFVDLLGYMSLKTTEAEDKVCNYWVVWVDVAVEETRQVTRRRLIH